MTSLTIVCCSTVLDYHLGMNLLYCTVLDWFYISITAYCTVLVELVTALSLLGATGNTYYCTVLN